MINLLPPIDQRQLMASRTNALILRYILLMSVVIAVMALEMLGVYVILNVDKQNSQTIIQANDEKAAAYQSVQKEADSFRSNLAVSKYILDQQVPYTGIIIALAQILPEGAAVDALSIMPATFGTPTSLIVHTSTRDLAVDVKALLQQASYNGKSIFSSVSFESLAVSTESGYTATFNVTYSKELGTQ